MRALVVGGTGFIGVNLVDALLAAGADVRVTRRKRSATILLQGRKVEWVAASLQEPGPLTEAMKDRDVVFVAGAYYPRYSLDLAASMEEGVSGVRIACQAARAAGVRRLVYTSTIATLAPAPPGRKADERDVHPSQPAGSVYRAVKWAMEKEIEDARAQGLDAVTLLPGGCIGPWDVRLGTGAILVGTIRGMLPWWVDGTVNLVDVEDVAQAHVAAATRGTSSRYCLTGHDVRVGALLRHIVQRYGGTMPPLELAPEEARARALADEREAAPARKRVPIPRELVDMATHLQPVSSALACEELGFRPAPLDETLDRAHAWFVRHHYLPSPNLEARTDAS